MSADESGALAETSTGATSPGSSSGAEGSADEGSTGTAIRCDKIDFLFVLEAPQTQADGEYYPSAYWGHDNSLVDGFATLVSELYVSVAVDDFRVLVTGSQPPVPSAPCKNDNCVEFELDECDQVLGAGRNGIALAGYEIPECTAGRYMESGAPNLESTFACLVLETEDTELGHGNLYGGPGPDTMMDALQASVSADNACNDGFLRDDALLVVVMLAPNIDSLADSSSGDVAAWTDALVAAKGGNADNVVVLALTADGDLEQPLCDPSTAGPFPAQLRDFVDGFENGKWASACIPDYGAFFTAAAEVIDGACEEFHPVG